MSIIRVQKYIPLFDFTRLHIIYHIVFTHLGNIKCVTLRLLKLPCGTFHAFEPGIAIAIAIASLKYTWMREWITRSSQHIVKTSYFLHIHNRYDYVIECHIYHMTCILLRPPPPAIRELSTVADSHIAPLAPGSCWHHSLGDRCVAVCGPTNPNTCYKSS